jgi:hypothetical protein
MSRNRFEIRKEIRNVFLIPSRVEPLEPLERFELGANSSYVMLALAPVEKF